ncbi:MAG TPA: tetratricopeptide repeat protein [Tepidisphaeraceae bacterium]
MKPLPPIEPCAFIDAVQPLLERQDLPGLLSLLKTRWTSEQIRGLIQGDHADAKKVALLAIGLVGTGCCLPELAKQLQDEDPMVNEMAEHALWSIWFRMGSQGANHELARGAQALGRREFEHAVEHFTRATEMSPDFAEAYNQRAIAHYLQEHWDESIADCQRAIERMPFHFGALAGMGHCYAHVGKLKRAIDCYEKALAVNPHLNCIQQAIGELKRRVRAGEDVEN